MPSISRVSVTQLETLLDHYRSKLSLFVLVKWVFWWVLANLPRCLFWQYRSRGLICVLCRRKYRELNQPGRKEVQPLIPCVVCITEIDPKRCGKKIAAGFLRFFNKIFSARCIWKPIHLLINCISIEMFLMFSSISNICWWSGMNGSLPSWKAILWRFHITFEVECFVFAYNDELPATLDSQAETCFQTLSGQLVFRKVENSKIELDIVAKVEKRVIARKEAKS